ncbi:MAG: OsmC-like protein [Rickettsiales bacterium]|jgi:peroxiredoxin-like protein|nr:OsmC-like protein [Rickettsiales bacterium]
MSEYKITLEWKRSTPDFVYETYNRNALLSFEGGFHMQVSNPSHYFGHAAHANPEELLVSALSCCYMQTFLAVACKQGYIVNEYRDHAMGITGQNEKGKKSVTEINLTPHIVFADKSPQAETLYTLQEKAHDNCFISNSLTAKITIKIQSSSPSDLDVQNEQKIVRE